MSKSPTPPDHFSAVAAAYADARPTYPRQLYDWIAGQCPAHDLAWDCATGNGQAAVDLARQFARVVATDVSAEQIARAMTSPYIDYRIAPASDSGLADASADLVTIAQALHWFAGRKFYDEVRRVLRPGGMIVAWSYGILHVEDEAIDQVCLRFYGETVEAYWPPERRHVEARYTTLPFPFPRIDVPEMHMEARWPLTALTRYFRSWSATGRYIATNGRDPVDGIEDELAALWGDPARPRRVTWPLTILAGRNA
ncbi:MAG: class I SAM-dependent methyltransferase [Hyphomicrobiaceae bacterium]